MHMPSDRDPRWSETSEREPAPDPWDLDQLALAAPPPPERWYRHRPPAITEPEYAATWSYRWARAMLAERARRAKEARP